MPLDGPEAPDPYETAQAQGAMNRETAITQQQLNMVNQINPWGSVSYKQNGTNSYTDSEGNVVTTPRYVQTTKFTPAQQKIFEESRGAQTHLAQLANIQAGKMKEYLNTPFEFDNAEAEQWAYDRASPRILQQQKQNEAMLRSTLANKGIREGSASWDAEMSRLTNANSDQMNQLELVGREQAFGESLATRNQPINEITALMSGSQVSNPASMSSAAPQTGVAGVDYAGLVGNQFAAQSANHQAKMGGLFGIASAGIGAVPW